MKGRRTAPHCPTVSRSDALYRVRHEGELVSFFPLFPLFDLPLWPMVAISKEGDPVLVPDSVEVSWPTLGSKIDGYNKPWVAISTPYSLVEQTLANGGWESRQ